ncbi:MAG: hypothetical protein HYU86_02110 [Chloroflexi bacterium]|nr:hypothetical protein [Chloroflexota bacterium]
MVKREGITASILGRQLSRRRVLRAFGGVGLSLASVALLACTETGKATPTPTRAPAGAATPTRPAGTPAAQATPTRAAGTPAAQTTPTRPAGSPTSGY